MDPAPEALPGVAELLDIAVVAVRRAGELARAMRVEGVTGVSTKSTATDVVTAADHAVERQVIDDLRARRPHDAVVGEESGTVDSGTVDGGGSRLRWILDPIDGTVNYLYGIPAYAVSLAAEVDGVIVAGVVRNPVTGHEWTATRGGGAYRDGHRLTGSQVTQLSQALLGTGFGYHAARRSHQARVVAQLIPEVRDIRRIGAASIDLCLAAEGALDAVYEKGLNLWDYAAGGLVAREAGLRVTGLAGAPPGPEMVLVAPAALYQPLHDRLVELDAAGGP
jgi:myo-inositol-1(or 4)-monophosphatase